jgi:pyruvate dehydrogenase E1 component
MTDDNRLGSDEAVETQEWLESLEWVLQNKGPERVRQLLEELDIHAQKAGVRIPFSANTPHINTIPVGEEPPYPGSREIERRIKSIIRWNAMAMVVRANMIENGIGGHISTYASAATLYEVAFNHFLHGKSAHYDGDQVYFQGHAAPGIYARAFLEGRLSEDQLKNFRRELSFGRGNGLSSYPHPWLMPDFWQFPTVSMGLSPIMAIYQARFNRYMEDRGITAGRPAGVGVSGRRRDRRTGNLGAITLAARERWTTWFL